MSVLPSEPQDMRQYYRPEVIEGTKRTLNKLRARSILRRLLRELSGQRETRLEMLRRLKDAELIRHDPKVISEHLYPEGR